MIIYHGTSYENAKKIEKNGFSPTRKTWNCSKDGMIYFHCCIDEKESQYKAKQSACITASLSKSQSTNIALISMEIDSKLIESFRDDCCKDSIELPISFLNNNYKIEYLNNCYIPSLSLAYLAGLDLRVLNIASLSNAEKEILRNQHQQNMLLITFSCCLQNLLK